MKKNGKSRGYLGLTKTKEPDGKKRRYFLVDTMQPCPPLLVIPVLRAMDKAVRALGYDGLTVGRKLEGAFNYRKVRKVIYESDAYRSGEHVQLVPEDEESWKDFEDELGGEDTYHSLNLNNDFVVLNFGRDDLKSKEV